MRKTNKTLVLKFERTIMAPPSEVYDAWLNPKIPGTPWYEGDKLILNAEVEGLFYWLIKNTPHFGRFTKLEKPARIQHTWMSPYTSGEESTVVVTFEKKGTNTLMTLTHSDLPDDELAQGHNEGWNYFLDKLVGTLNK